jgi:adenylate cyclase
MDTNDLAPARMPASCSADMPPACAHVGHPGICPGTLRLVSARDDRSAMPKGLAMNKSSPAKCGLQSAHLKTMVTEELSPIGHSERIVRTVLMVDVVESVRLMEADEEGAIGRWRQLVDHVARVVLPAHGGRLAKSMGDGLLLEFPSVQPAVTAAFAIQRASDIANLGLSTEQRMLLRMGAQVGEFIADEHDLYGRGVNLAARLTTLAGPGEIVVSAGVRDQLTPFLDADVEDLGECFLKHVKDPVRAYRLGPPGPRPVIEPGGALVPELRPTIAVIPFAARTAAPEHQVLGEVLADEIISNLSRSAALNVISRLSTTAFRGRDATLREVSTHLNATYVLTGSYRVSGSHVAVAVELAESKSGRIVWSGDVKGQVAGILNGEDELVERVVTEIGSAVLTRELQRAQSQALPTLESYTLLMAAIALMHRLSAHDFDRARQMLQTLIDRSPRLATPYAWLAKWHVLRVQQGWTDEPKNDAHLAMECTQRALDADPDCSLALAVDGFVHTNLLKKLDIGLERYELALRVNPNDSLACLLKGTLHAFKGEGKLAVDHTRRALRLSPLDPQRWFYDSLAATAALSAAQYERAIELGLRSLRANRTHTSTFRAIAISQWQLGKFDDARGTVAELMRLEPTLTMKGWLERSPSSAYETGKVWFNALRQAGVPQ